MNTLYRLWQAFGRFAAMLDGLSATGESVNARARLHLELPAVEAADVPATHALPLNVDDDDPDANVPRTRRLPSERLNGHKVAPKSRSIK